MPNWQPDWAVPPGEILLEVLEDRGMTQSELARRTGRPLKTINEIIKGKAAVTAETAIQLERVLGVTARFWNNLESNYREALARQREQRELEKEITWAKRFPLKALEQYRLIHGDLSAADSVGELLSFFRVSSRSAWERGWLAPSAAFRASPAFSSSPESVAAWLRWGEIQASETDLGSFNARRFREVLGEIRHLTSQEPLSTALDRTRDLCSGCGVALVITPELPGVRVSGASRWLASDRVLIQLSLRYKSDDQLWFSFFHEAGHVLLPARRRDFIDALQGGSGDPEAEDLADNFARDELIAPSDYRAFLDKGDLTEPGVRSFAQQLGIAPGIVVARLQHDAHLEPAHLNGLKRRLRLVHPPIRAPR
jgi:addiction module HigA family antidote